MGCSRLDRNALIFSMEKIKTANDELYNYFNWQFKEGINNFYNGWKSVKGYEKTSDFAKKVEEQFKTVEKSICAVYNSVKEGAEDFARIQQMNLKLGDINNHSFEIDKKTYSSTAPIDIVDETITTGKDDINTWTTNTADALDRMLERTASNESFGYWSDYGDIVGQLNKVLTNLKENLGTACSEYFGTFDNEVEEDRALRNSNVQNATQSIGSAFLG